MVGITPRCAMRSRRARGYVVDIPENSSANTPTPYLLKALVRTAYLRGSETAFSSAWVRAPAYTSHRPTSGDAPIQEGTPILGILLPTSGDCLNAPIATRGVGSLLYRRNEGIGHQVPTSDVDRDPRPRAPLPSLGAAGFTPRRLPRALPDCA